MTLKRIPTFNIKTNESKLNDRLQYLKDRIKLDSLNKESLLLPDSDGFFKSKLEPPEFLIRDIEDEIKYIGKDKEEFSKIKNNFRDEMLKLAPLNIVDTILSNDLYTDIVITKLMTLWPIFKKDLLKNFSVIDINTFNEYVKEFLGSEKISIKSVEKSIPILIKSIEDKNKRINDKIKTMKLKLKFKNNIADKEKLRKLRKEENNLKSLNNEKKDKQLEIIEAVNKGEIEQVKILTEDLINIGKSVDIVNDNIENIVIEEMPIITEEKIITKEEKEKQRKEKYDKAKERIKSIDLGPQEMKAIEDSPDEKKINEYKNGLIYKLQNVNLINEILNQSKFSLIPIKTDLELYNLFIKSDVYNKLNNDIFKNIKGSNQSEYKDKYKTDASTKVAIIQEITDKYLTEYKKKYNDDYNTYKNRYDYLIKGRNDLKPAYKEDMTEFYEIYPKKYFGEGINKKKLNKNNKRFQLLKAQLISGNDNNLLLKEYKKYK